MVLCLGFPVMCMVMCMVMDMTIHMTIHMKEISFFHVHAPHGPSCALSVACTVPVVLCSLLPTFACSAHRCCCFCVSQTTAILGAIRRTKRAILLTGTPSLSRYPMLRKAMNCTLQLPTRLPTSTAARICSSFLTPSVNQTLSFKSRTLYCLSGPLHRHQ